MLRLPTILVHRGKVYQLSETKRKGLVLQLAESEKKFLDSPRGICAIVLSTRWASLRRPGTSLRRQAREGENGSTTFPGFAVSGGPNTAQLEGRMMRKTATKKMVTKAPASMQEVKKLSEPVRPATHCGVPMRKFSHPSTLGGLNTVFVCAKECGHREQITATGR